MRSRKFIHMGSIISICIIFWCAGAMRLSIKPMGNAMIRQMTVAMTACTMPRANTVV